MLIAGAYYYSIYAQYGGIDFRQTTCILESAWYEYLGTDSYDVKIIVNYAIDGETWRKTMTYNNYADLADAELVSMFLIQYSPNITCYTHPLNEVPLRTLFDLHQKFVDGVGLLVPALVLFAGSIVGIVLLCVSGKRRMNVNVAQQRRINEQMLEQEQRR
jgi:hypothetical protein